jgi:hypothetical protein
VTTAILFHDECEHSGDITRDIEILRATLGMGLIVHFSTTGRSAEVGVSVVATSATLRQVQDAIGKSGEHCISGMSEAVDIEHGQRDARSWIESEDADADEIDEDC